MEMRARWDGFDTVQRIRLEEDECLEVATEKSHFVKIDTAPKGFLLLLPAGAQLKQISVEGEVQEEWYLAFGE